MVAISASEPQGELMVIYQAFPLQFEVPPDSPSDCAPIRRRNDEWTIFRNVEI